MKFMLLILLAICTVFAENDKIYCIVADIANIRSQPKPDAKIIARLRIGNCFYAKKISGEWAFLDSVHNLAVNGWVNLSACVDNRVDPAFIDNQIKQAKTFADTIKWCERRVALTPDSKDFLKALQKGYTALGDSARAREIGRRLRGTDPTYIAQRWGKQIRLRGVIDSSSEFRTLEWKECCSENAVAAKWNIPEGSDKTQKKEALQIRLSLAAMAWFQGEDSPLYFPAPIVVPTDAQKAQGKIGDYYHDFDGAITFGISLGSAPEYMGEIFATKPVYFVRPTGLLAKSQFDSLTWFEKQLVGPAFDSGGMTDVHYGNIKEYGFVDVTVCGDMGLAGRAQQRGIFNRKRECVWPPEGYTFIEAIFGPAKFKGAICEEDENQSLGTEFFDARSRGLTTRWFRFGPDASFPAFTITPFSTHYSIPSFEESNGNFGLHLVRISKTGAKTFVIRSEYAGD
jgi:hypothetical protein